jgi:type II secretory pathway pseudopilin PulG
VNRKIRYRHQSKARKPVNGFSMVEVLIAGILLASALAAVSRISVAALSGSARLSDRARIEAAINDNIQTMQKEDSYFTDAWIIKNGGESALQSACLNPTEALSNHLKSVAPEPRLAAITRSFDISSVPGILQIVYSFEGPERQITVEKRIIEMTPNFASKCYSMQ